MAGPQVAVVGGGPTGLAAAIYLARSGCRVVVYEQRGSPGGLCASWRRGPYLFEQGLEWLADWQPGFVFGDVLSELGVSQDVPLFSTESLTTVYDEEAEWVLKVGNDLAVMERTLLERFAEDRKMRKLDTMKVMPPAEERGLLFPAKQLTALGFAVPLFTTTPWTLSTGDVHTADPNLRKVLSTVMGGVVPVWFLMMLFGMLAEGRLGMSRAGCGRLIQSLVDRALQAGVTIRTNTDVEKILVSSGAASGVRLADGTEERADAVISTVDSESLFQKLLGEQYCTGLHQEMHSRWDVVKGRVIVHLGVEGDYHTRLPRLCDLINVQAAIRTGAPLDEDVHLRIEGPPFAPEGHTCVQVQFDTDWSHWETDRAGYAREKRLVVNEAVAMLERKMMPGLGEAVRVCDVVTPVTMRRCTRLRRGAWLGWAPSNEILNAAYKLRVPNLKRFAVAGTWAMPGGGLPCAGITARFAASFIAKDLRARWNPGAVVPLPTALEPRLPLHLPREGVLLEDERGDEIDRRYVPEDGAVVEEGAAPAGAEE